MNIVVLVKQVPDTWAERSLSSADRTLNRDSVDAVVNELDEYAVEEALRLKEAHGGTVTVLSMGPARVTETIRKVLSMGVDAGIHVHDDALHGSDAIQTARAIAAAVGTVEWDLVLTGVESTDARMSVVPALLAEVLGVAQLSRARAVTVDGGTVRIERNTDDGYVVVEAALPAVLSVVEKINEPRYPSFKGIMQAKSKPVTTLTAADLGLDAGTLGLAAAYSQVAEVDQSLDRQVGQVVKDDGDGGTKIAEYLVSRKLV
jgi:electron transfer flavoprotein beta subunit